MNIAVCSIYDAAYDKDRLFDLEACKLGQNILLPGIRLKQELERRGHIVHTVDCFSHCEVNRYVFSDMPSDSLLFIRGPRELVKYILDRRWKKDYLLRSFLHVSKDKRVLVLHEPPVVRPYQYERDRLKHFGTVFSWDDDIVDDCYFFHFNYPQPIPEDYNMIEPIPFCQKNLVTMICGNKSCDYPKELYSERRKVIDFYEEHDALSGFDLYGFGYNGEGLTHYRGTTDDKLATLRQYKFSYCYENMCGVNGYITEKIFDCFFAGCVPIYWGAENVEKYVDPKCFIDRRKFDSTESLDYYLRNMTEGEYLTYQEAIKEYLSSDLFYDNFSVEAYVSNLINHIVG